MAFNDFLDKVKSTSVNAMDKAKDTTKRMANITELKGKIRGYNNDKNKLFTQMGMDLYIAKKQGETIDSAIDEFVSQIDTINVRIKNLQEKLALIEGGNEVDAKDVTVEATVEDHVTDTASAAAQTETAEPAKSAFSELDAQ